ncbi:MAG: hypothetical protein ABH950_03540 [Candidatus Altiarchaeota archaeon]
MRKYLLQIKDGIQRFGKFVASVVNVVLLTLVYAFGVGFTSIVSKIVKKDFLILKPRKKSSFWRDHEDHPPTEENLGRMF